MKSIIFLLTLAITSVNFAFAAQANIETGKTKAGMCLACHGVLGISGSEDFPNLAGQHADYITKQLKAFKSDERKDPVMSSMAMGLSEQDMVNIAGYFSSLPRTATTSSGEAQSTAPVAAVTETIVAYKGNASAGKNLYELGDSSRSIGACIGCHGKEGNSNVLIYPNLAKQHGQYIEKQLHAFKTKSRTNYAMNQFAGNMTVEEIADIGAYLADTKAVANVKTKAVVVAVTATEEAIAGKSKAVLCASCHGADGNSVVTTYPKLAGQNASYIAKQLAEFKDGSRKDPIMAGMVATLSEQDMLELGAYFSSQKSTVGDGETSDLGRKLYFGGDTTRGITACIACHGVNGKGMEKAGFPAIANQNIEYLSNQLNNFKTDARANDKNSMMRNIAKKLKKNDIAALTQFMASMK